MQIEKSLLYQSILIVAFWIRCTWGFFADMIPLMMAMQSIVFLAFDAVIIALGLAMMTRMRDRKWAVVFVAVTGYITCAINSNSVAFYINGLRDFISYIFVIPIINYFFEKAERKKRFVEAFDRTLFWFLVAQVPATIIQFLAYGAGDAVGGTLGYGGSGIISTMIFAISFYLLKKHIDKNNFMMSLWENKVYILLLIPTQLNETKISFIFLLMYFLLLMPLDKKMFIRMLFAIPIMFLLMWMVMTAYVVSTGGSMGDAFSLEYYTEMYLYDDTGDSAAWAEALAEEDSDLKEDVPRFTKLMLLEDVHIENPGHIISGFGVGHFKGGSVVQDSEFFRKYEWMMTGSIPYVFHVWVQLGIVGMILMTAFFVLLMNAKQPNQRRDYNVCIYFILTILLILFYNDSIRFAFMVLPFAYIIMVSWRDPQEIEEENIEREGVVVNCNAKDDE